MSSDWKKARIEGKVVLITGASDGLGKAAALDLARRGGKIYMLGRNQTKTDAARQYVLDESKVDPEMVQVMIVDLASLKSVRDFAAAFKEKETRIDVLMNNAGIMMVPQGKTQDGFERQFGTNVLGHYLLTHLLMEQLAAAAPGSRTVNLSSSAHEMGMGDMQFDNLMFDTNYSPMNAYAQSKLSNILFNLELSKRLKDAGITCYAVHPGAVKTNLSTDSSGIWKYVIMVTRPFFKSVDNGAQTQIRCAVDPGYAEQTGHYYADCKQKQPTRAAQNAESAAKLWTICTDLVKLTPEETHSLLK